MILDEIISYIQAHKEVDYLHFWLGDNYNNFCECDACREKMPTDWYFMMLNELDHRLTALNLDTKIVFLVYVELLWTAKEIKLENPDRFVMMFAPISRTYSYPLLEAGKTPNKSFPLPPFELNKIALPTSTEGNLAFLYEHQKHFKGDSFDFDYHLMWEPNKDLSGLQIASIIYQDVQALDALGLRGLSSCQTQKVFMPHGFGMFVMGRTLEDPTLSLQELYREYFSATYGKHYAWATGVLEEIASSNICAYLRNECPQTDAEIAKSFETFQDVLRERAKQAKILLDAETDEILRLSLHYLHFYCELLQKYCEALRIKALGEPWEKIEPAYRKMREYLFAHEDEVCLAMDTFEYDMMSEQILRSNWSVLQREN